MEKSFHDSEVQQKIEDWVRFQLSQETGIKLEKKAFVIEGSKFQVDLFNKENGFYGEIYACTGSLKSGQKRKIASDMLKLLTIEKLEKDKVKIKAIVLTEPAILPNLLRKAWVKSSIDLFNFKIIPIELPPELERTLTQAKFRQGSDFRKE